MRRELIPDAVLWAFTGSERELVTLPGYGVVCCSDMGGFGLDLARELLALRGAARCVFECMSGSWAEVDPKTLDVLREALPPMQPKEPE